MDKKLKISIDDAQVSHYELLDVLERVAPELENMQRAVKKKYDDPRASLSLVSDKSILNESQAMADKFKEVSIIVVVGIGGSNLGALAVYESLGGLYANSMSNKKIFFADTTDAFKMHDMIISLKKELEKGKKIVLNVVSKSGSTTETIANFELLYRLLREYLGEEANSYIVATSDEDSKLHKLAQDKGFEFLSIPKKVGGRFSVFSNVGMFPLAFMGVDISKLQEGARDMRNTCLVPNKTNPAVMSVASIYQNARVGRKVMNTFVFTTQLKSIGIWYRQLLGESIAKEYNRNMKKVVHFGLTPTYAVGSTDLHSMAQFYLAGPDTTFHMFFHVKHVPQLVLPKYDEFDSFVKDIQGKSLSHIMNSIYGGVKESFRKDERPFYSIELNSIDEYTIGALLQMKQIEIMLLAELFDVNPFDQPNVEQYKVETRKLLEKHRDENLG